MTHAPEVTDNKAESRLEFVSDGDEADLFYRIRAGRLVLTHTEVPEEMAGHGVGGRLVQAALAKATAEGLTVVPFCPFARSWLERHPDAKSGIEIDWAARP
jgi:uncharacterized protein